ncbi:hypothetical protein [Streptomyces sp. ITFR-6]|uniref:hypothetical protein n=1 Tax=Streptomyces sp. ITFR-6 TaxID=3075197 RepID=UPI002889A292|nr:hypothetical protein [Streptomyces sp. ITFR-6]WNI27873.1 hypothetical protein RLT59_03140 [Streptomyces sp. ITFR-6]
MSKRTTEIVAVDSVAGRPAQAAGTASNCVHQVARSGSAHKIPEAERRPRRAWRAPVPGPAPAADATHRLTATAHFAFDARIS